MDNQTTRDILEFAQQLLQSDAMVANAGKLLITAAVVVRILEPVILKVWAIAFKK